MCAMKCKRLKITDLVIAVIYQVLYYIPRTVLDKYTAYL